MTFFVFIAMNIKGRKLPFFLEIGALSIISPFIIAGIGLPSSTTSAITDSPKELIDQVWQIIYRDFLDSSGKYNNNDWKKLRKKLLSKQYADKEESYSAINGMLASLEDPYTRFLDPKQFKEMKIDTSGELTGVGIQLSLDEQTNNLVIVSPIEGTPAFKAGVMPKDVIVQIDGKTTKNMTIETAVKLIRGKEGTKVNLGLDRNGDFVNVQLVRERIEIHAVKSHLNLTNSGVKVGYIRLKQFSANASKEMRSAISRLENKGVNGYVLDLRSNPGGLLEASIDISRQWLDKGIIVSTQTKNGIKDVRRANGSALTTRPVVILVNEGSASASEILSGAIQDNKRGILVGQKTFGKGLVQSVRGLSDGSGLTVTIAKYLTPSGTDIHKNGINPDVFAEMSVSNAESLTIDQLGSSTDSQYKVAEMTLIKSLNRINKGLTFSPTSSNYLIAIGR